MPVAAIVLAAGGSSRLGRPKQLVSYRGQPLVRHAAQIALGAGCDRTLVVVSDDAVRAALDGLGAEIIDNPDWREGVASSIRRGVESAGDSDVLLTLCDQPLVTAEHLRALVVGPLSPPRGERGRGEGSQIIIATSYRNIAGVPAFFPSRFRNELLALRGDHGARAIIRKHDAVTINFEDAAFDVDTAADAARL